MNTNNNNDTITRRVVVVVGAEGGSVVHHLLRYNQKHDGRLQDEEEGNYNEGDQNSPSRNRKYASNMWHIRGLTRNSQSEKARELAAKGVEIMECNINNREDLEVAFQGAYAVFLMTNYWDQELVSKNQNEETKRTYTSDDRKIAEIQQGKLMAQAASHQKVKHLIWSLPDADTLSEGKITLPHYSGKYQVEKYIREELHNIEYATFLYIGFYYENFLTFMKPTPATDDTQKNIKWEFRSPLWQHTTLPIYDVEDTGAVVLKCLLQPDRYGKDHRIPLAAANLTLNQIAKILSQATGENTKHTVISIEEYALDHSLESVNNMRWYNEYAPAHDIRLAEETLRIYPQMKPFAQWVNENSQHFKANHRQ